MFLYELNGCGFESSCSHLNFRFCACFEQRVPWHSDNYRVWIHSETRTWRDKNIQLHTFFFEAVVSVMSFCQQKCVTFFHVSITSFKLPIVVVSSIFQAIIRCVGVNGFLSTNLFRLSIKSSSLIHRLSTLWCRVQVPVFPKICQHGSELRYAWSLTLVSLLFAVCIPLPVSLFRSPE